MQGHRRLGAGIWVKDGKVGGRNLRCLLAKEMERTWPKFPSIDDSCMCKGDMGYYIYLGRELHHMCRC